jgi:hypothetical protein
MYSIYIKLVNKNIGMKNKYKAGSTDNPILFTPIGSGGGGDIDPEVGLAVGVVHRRLARRSAPVQQIR